MQPDASKFSKVRYQVSNWYKYDQVLQNRGSLTVWVTPEAISACRHRSRVGAVGGLPLFKSGHRDRASTAPSLPPALAVNRRLAALDYNLLGVSLEVPNHTASSRRSPGLSRTLPQLLMTGPGHVLLDSNGLKVYGAGEWQREKHSGRGRRSWRKLHFAVNPECGEILALELVTNEVGDLTMTFGPDGELYVSNQGAVPSAGAGQIVQIDIP